jgi:Flp pilus assembly protein TadG
MGRKPARLRARSERGAAAVEAAVVLCFVVLPLIFAGISYGYMFSFRQALSQAASEGARAAVGAQTGTACASGGGYSSSCPAQYAASQAVRNALTTYGMACGSGNLTCSISAPTSAGCSTGHTCITVTVTYPYRNHSLIPTVPGLGFTLPSSLSFTSVVEAS